ncbi:diacylglycerol acyltransferase family protein [Cryptosporidium andersoni]|uniref:diacylglycerol O-acyltransferase n=1 Tax=Cryptosporidium andersoni TaxID=117008 RepID=A0A1J4MRG8_9CRYT|nr:diacylglycerol acyltransferase family protein [Cryptosporidium andersoni]
MDIMFYSSTSFSSMTLPELPYIFKKFSLLIITDMNNWTGPCKIIVESPDFEKNQKQLLGIHPHGVTSIGLMNIVKITEAIIWLQPIIWSILSMFATLRGASHTSFRNIMKREESPLIMFPGGFQESTILDWGVDEIYIKNRYGFIKYCMQYNYRIRPVYVFGECLTFNNTKFARNLRLFLNKFSIPGVFPYGDYWWLPFLPKKNVPLLVVIGSPIKVPYFPENPPRDEIKKYHKIYIERLQELYRTYSPKYLESFTDYEVIKKYKEIKLPEISLI